jgi:hypothetical protein
VAPAVCRSSRDRQQHALARPGVDSIVCFGDAVQGQGIAGRYRESAFACCGGEIDSGLLFCRRGEVVAAEESDCQVGEEQGQKGKSGLSRRVA